MQPKQSPIELSSSPCVFGNEWNSPNWVHLTKFRRFPTFETRSTSLSVLTPCAGCVCSYLGACQLELDLLYVRTWLASYLPDSALRSAVLSHEGLMYVDAAVSLLKQQPPVLAGNKSAAPAVSQRKSTKKHAQRRQFRSFFLVFASSDSTGWPMKQSQYQIVNKSY